LLYQNSAAGIAAGSVMFLAAMAAMLYLGVVTPGLWIWGAINFVCFCIGFLQLRAYRAASPESKAQPVWGQRIVIGGIVAGALWGVLTFYLAGPLKGHEIPVVSGMVLLMVGAVSGYAVYAPAIFGFSSGIVTTSVLGLVSTPGPYHISLAVMMLAVFAAVVQFGVISNRAYTKALVLDLKNRELIESLTKHQLQLEAANEARLQFFASASHDLRQPMHALGLFSEGLRDFVSGAEGQRVYRRMQTSIGAMENLIDQLLSVANMDAGAVVPKPVRLPLQYLFNSLQASHEALAQAKGLKLRFHPTRAVVYADPILMSRLLGNLVTNAIRYTERGRVLIGCRRHGEKRDDGAAATRGLLLRIDVIDTGCGIAAAHFDRIFEEFVQLNNPERDRSKGLGLGLAIVKRIAALTGCDVSVASALGRGSRFSITIPRMTESEGETQEAEPTAAMIDAPDIAGALIVVIDDERDIRDALASLLARWGAFVVSAASQQDALQKLEREERLPDLLICDLRLADHTSGIDVIANLRRELEFDVPAILVSGDTAPKRQEEARAANLQLVHKPLSAQKLSALLSGILQDLRRGD
jgi:signal transduction histidine kinase